MSKRLIKPIKIAMSGYSGCGNTTAGRMVAMHLGIEHVNYTFRSLAEDKGISFNDLRQLAQEDDAIDIELDKRQLALASSQPCVLSSRLAIWLLKDADMRVFLDIPLLERANRIHKREGGTLDVKTSETKQRDSLDQERYQRIYGIDMTDFHFVDLIIDDITLSAEEVAQKIIEAIPSEYFASELKNS